MRFRNSLRIFMENFGNVYKMLLYKLAVGLIFVALSAALIVPRMSQILESTQWLAFVGDLKAFVKAVASGNAEYLTTFKDSFTGTGGTVEALLALLKDMIPSLVWVLLGVVFFYLLKRVADTVCHYTVGGVLNDRLSTFAETPFTAAYVKNLGKAFKYSLVYVPLMFLYNVVVVALCYFLFFYLLKLISFQPILLSLFLTTTFIVFAEALKLALTGFWLPSMTTGGEGIKSAMKIKGKIEKGQFKRIFSVYVVTIYLILFLNVAGAICTFGSVLLLTVPASYFMLICVQYVNYYTATGRKYFLAFDRVFDSPTDDEPVRYFAATATTADGDASDEATVRATESTEEGNQAE